MGTFRLGLSMSGTVSAGTYTAGSLIELNKWLYNWQQAKKNGVSLKAICDIGNFREGDNITFTPNEVPDHKVLINALTGASGGGVSAALFILGLTFGNLESLLHDSWVSFDIKDMLDTDDVKNTNTIYSLLNVKPIENIKNNLSSLKWGETNNTAELDYLADVVEVYLTLASYEGIPYRLGKNNASTVKGYEILKTHMDYIRFGFVKNPVEVGTNGEDDNPYRYSLQYRPNQKITSDTHWAKLIEAAPATGAFPIGFRPRTIKRFRKEYEGKLFFLNYTIPSNHFETISPEWLPGHLDDSFDMEYFDGGTFNNDPHDLARASLLRFINSTSPSENHINKLDSDGETANSAVILIDPFPTIEKKHNPGEIINELPDLLKQVPLLISSLLDQGRFRPDVLEKAINDSHYSKFLISPIRRNIVTKVPEELALAGGLFGAFSGFIDKSFREHDYRLGHYNTFQFLSEYFTVPITNNEVTYYNNATDALKEKYEAVGWFKSKDSHCQIIPRCEEPNLQNSVQPNWPSISADNWDNITGLATQRAKEIEDTFTNFKIGDNLKDWAIWKFIQPKFNTLLDKIKKELKDNGLLR